jgi:outer membrane protein assembly factor BamA
MCLLGVATPVLAQEPDTREEVLRREREAKSKQLTPHEPNGLERALFALENTRVFERLLNPPEGFYPKIGTVTPGSGLSFGPAYRRPGLFNETTDFSVFAAGSFKKYWMIDARLTLPRLAGNSVFLEFHGQRYDFPEEDFFGLGPASRREDYSTFGLRSSAFGGSGGIRPTPWLSFGGKVDLLTPDISRGNASAPQSVVGLFDASQVPGVGEQPDFIRYEVFADLNYRDPRGNPRQGGRYYLGYQTFQDRELDRYDFRRFETDIQQYVPLLKDRRVLALRAHASLSDTAAGHEVPFYFQRTLGGPDDLRGFRRFRFRDRNLLLLQAEYRWEIFTAVDGAIFYDAGKVFSRREDLDLRDLESDYGIGFRFGTVNGVFLRVEGAFGSRGGAHYVFRFGHVF